MREWFALGLFSGRGDGFWLQSFLAVARTVPIVKVDPHDPSRNAEPRHGPPLEAILEDMNTCFSI